MASKAPALSPMTIVYSGSVAIGFLYSRGRQGIEAHSNSGESLGLFPNVPTAASAVTQIYKAEVEQDT
jgi:hypothetical protein